MAYGFSAKANLYTFETNDMLNLKILKKENAQAITEFIVTLIPLWISLVFIVQVSLWIITAIQNERLAYSIGIRGARSEGYDYQGAMPLAPGPVNYQEIINLARAMDYDIYIETLPGAEEHVQKRYASDEVPWWLQLLKTIPTLIMNLAGTIASIFLDIGGPVDGRATFIAVSKKVPSLIPFFPSLTLSTFHVFIIDPFYPLYPSPTLFPNLWLTEF